MNISAPFIRRKVATTLLTIGVALAGVLAYRALPVAPLPPVEFPTISVTATLPGASAEIMASSVVTPLERQIGQIAGVTEMTSSSSLGSTQITIQFDLSRDVDGAGRDVQAAINAARTYLPANLPSNPTYRKVNPADAPIFILGLTSRAEGPDKVYDVASTVVAQSLSQISGVGQVSVGGGALPSVRVDVHPTQLASYGLTMTDVQAVLSRESSSLAKGRFEGPAVAVDIVANDQISHASEYQSLIVGMHDGVAVHLADVAEVTDSVQNVRVAGYLNGSRAIPLIVFRQPGANIIATVDRIREHLPFLRASIPSDIDVNVVLDRTTTIRASVSEVEKTLAISIVLVIVVVFVFLRDARATIIAGVAVPVSLLGTVGVMYLLGFTLDNLSLMALTISTGFVVDDAIVVMENITRHREAGMAPMAAALKGAEEIGFTVVSISLSLVAVFIPILLMGGIVGRLFREFAITLSLAILVSMLVSLTTTPMMCAWVLRAEAVRPRAQGSGRWSRLGRILALVSDAPHRLYRRSLHWVLARPALTLFVLAIIIALNFVLVVKMPKGFFPPQDTGALAGAVRGPENASFQSMDASTKEIGRIIREDPAVENVITFTGGGGATNTGFVFIALKPLGERNVAAQAVVNRLRPKLAGVGSAATFLQPVQDLRFGGRVSNAMYQYTIQSDDIADLAKWGPLLLAEMQRLPGFLDVSSDQQNGGLAQRIELDRSVAARLGLTTQAVDQALYDSFGQAQVSIIYTPVNQYYVVLEVDPRYSQGPEGLSSVYLRGPGSDRAIPLRTVARDRATTTPLALNHTSFFPSITLSFNLGTDVSLSDATVRIDEMKRRLNMPSTLRSSFSGTLLQYQDSLATEPPLVITALLAVYIVLGMLYENLVHPITIISTLPSASVGAMLALILFHEDLNVVSLIGVVLLIGIVKKNAIMMIDFAIAAERNEGRRPVEAIFEASVLRFRPITMTTMAALLGALPLAFMTGTRHELRRPLGIAIVGGLMGSQLLTLYSTPVIYLVFDRMRLRLRRGRGTS